MRAVLFACVSVWCVLLSVTPWASGQEVASVSVEATAVRDICRLPIKKGWRLGSFTRYAFNSTVGQCLPFRYGGFGGNANNFATLNQCDAKCPLRCPSGEPLVRCLAAPCSVNSCPAFPDAQCFNNYCGGCNAIFVLPNGRHVSAEECAAPPPRDRACQLPIVSGPCLAYMPRFAFNRAEGQCRPFIYGGCGGNANNFATRDQCARTCPEVCPPDKPQAMCFVAPCSTAQCPAVPDAQCMNSYCGGCKALFVKNGRVLSADECALPPPPPPPPSDDVCTLPIAVGPCRAAMPRYAFSSRSGRCVPFKYGGCLGNANNFMSLDACSARCPPSSPPPRPPPRCGKCPFTPCAATLCTADSRCVNDFCNCRGVCVKLRSPFVIDPLERSLVVDPPQLGPFVDPEQPNPIVDPSQPDPIVNPDQPDPIVDPPQPDPIVDPPQPDPVVDPPQPDPIVDRPQPDPIVDPPQPDPIVDPPQPDLIVVPPQ